MSYCRGLPAFAENRPAVAPCCQRPPLPRLPAAPCPRLYPRPQRCDGGVARASHAPWSLTYPFGSPNVARWHAQRSAGHAPAVSPRARSCGVRKSPVSAAASAVPLALGPATLLHRLCRLRSREALRTSTLALTGVSSRAALRASEHAAKACVELVGSWA